MNLHRASIVPIELFSRENVAEAYKKISLCSIDCESLDYELTIREICGEKAKILRISNDFYIVFYETSIAGVIITRKKNWLEGIDAVARELLERNNLHKKIISGDYAPIKSLNLDAFYLTRYAKPKINYVFSFYVMECPSVHMDYTCQAVLAEPSIVDMDDMISSHLPQKTFRSASLDIPQLEDVDISQNCRTFITWASLACSVQKNPDSTLGLLIALECRLQMTWNKCFVISGFIDEIFTGERTLKNPEELYWGFTKALDDAKSVISSTYSSRADKLFVHMMETSKIKGELNRLDRKVALVEKFVRQEERKRDSLYQKTIELLLFITALFSVIEVFFVTPLNLFSAQVRIFLLVVLGIVGLIAILARK